ncbi:PDR/VanB family oxidoreductase [Pelomonas sp. KK5]|uniref:PDR/VanB family oxidoreductase n=1 Tax=Pelomonas sp. KK5 TaxID=1855730 RepID=UPI001E4D10D0|nr:PDR/VanB family oxidoreductase [Pelomonas sp. KK5]
MSGPSRILGVNQMSTLSVRVTAVAKAALDVRQLQLALPDGAPLPAYEPGSHIDVHLGPSLVRQYSLCGECGDLSTYTIAVKREANSRGGSRAVHESLSVGTELKISRPRNNFPMAADAEHSLLLAGGIGITPLISMARALQAGGRSFELAAFSRSLDHLAFRADLETGKLAPSSRIHHGLSRDDTEAALRAHLSARRENAHIYLCGPAPFMATGQALARALGWPEEAIHIEHFAPASAPATGADEWFEVRLSRTGVVIPVAPAQTIVDAMRARGMDVETSCEQGVCGTCITSVLSGEPDHRDCFLTAREHAKGDCMAICVSRSRSPLLVLDL